MSRFYPRCLLIALICILLYASSFGAASRAVSSGKQTPKVVIFIMDWVTWDDYLTADAPTLRRIIDTGAIGLMMARTAGTPDRGGYLTIGAGTRLKADDIVGPVADIEGFAFAPTEQTPLGQAAGAYQWLSGVSPTGAQALHLGVTNALKENSEVGHLATPGLLAEALSQAGYTVACIGNADLPGRFHRPVVAIGMDSAGRCALADIGPNLIENGPAEFQRTSVPALQAAFDRFLPQANILAVDFGDTSRLQLDAQLFTDTIARTHRLHAIHRADAFLTYLLRRMEGKDWRLLIVTPHLREEESAPDSRMTPVIVFGSGIQPGLLTSDSTRLRGIIANTDIASTLLHYLGRTTPSQMVGRVIRTTPSVGMSHLSDLTREIERRSRTEQQRFILTRPVMVAAIVIFVACILVLLFPAHVPLWVGHIARIACLVLLCWPGLLALAGLWLPSNSLLSWLLIAAGMVLGTLFMVRVQSRLSAITAICAGTALLFVIDLLVLNQRMLGYSPLSYSPADGARYYGLGNEFGGVLLGAALFGCISLWQAQSLWMRAFRWPLMAAIVVLIGQSSLGANFGMTLAAVVAFSTVGVMLLKGFRVRQWLWVLALCGVLIGIIALDARQTTGASHIAVSAQHLQEPSQSDVGDLIVRKLEMNWKLLKYSLWSEVMITGLLLCLLLVLKPSLRFATLYTGHTGFRITFVASLIGGVAALCFNDSGTLAAALCFLYPATISASLAFGREAAPIPGSVPATIKERETSKSTG